MLRVIFIWMVALSVLPEAAVAQGAPEDPSRLVRWRHFIRRYGHTAQENAGRTIRELSPYALKANLLLLVREVEPSIQIPLTISVRGIFGYLNRMSGCQQRRLMHTGILGALGNAVWQRVPPVRIWKPISVGRVGLDRAAISSHVFRGRITVYVPLLTLRDRPQYRSPRYAPVQTEIAFGRKLSYLHIGYSSWELHQWAYQINKGPHTATLLFLRARAIRWYGLNSVLRRKDGQMFLLLGRYSPERRILSLGTYLRKYQYTWGYVSIVHDLKTKRRYLRTGIDISLRGPMLERVR